MNETPSSDVKHWALAPRAPGILVTIGIGAQLILDAAARSTRLWPESGD